MASCAECVHVEVCKDYINAVLGDVDESQMCGDDCEFYKDRARFVELPCKVGDTLYTIVRGHKIRKWIVTDICISEFFSSNGMEITARDKDGSEHIRFAEHYSGKTVFLTIEEAEKAVKEREA